MSEIFNFFTDPANWAGQTGIPNRLFEHLVISGLAILVATIIGLPLGLYIGHTGRGANLAINLANIGRAVPSYAITPCMPVGRSFWICSISVLTRFTTSIELAFGKTKMPMKTARCPEKRTSAL